ncbi:hypothetical protein [Desertimonas flava]|uniref:hypothetical protein n=1 Tax=Desertimonas flava TaxID=2064846 RepID=UPI001969356E|nr:hypothetical protein [Desertimonas flava]
MFDHGSNRLVHQQKFAESDKAVSAYFLMEQTHKDRPEIEIVLIGSDSLETVKVTHANYFDETVGVPKYLIGI